MTKQWGPLTATAARRLPVGRNFAFFQWHRPPGFNVNVITTYVRFSTVFYGYCAPAVSGVIFTLTGYLGKPSTARAAPYYFDQWKRAGLFEQINTRLNQLDRQQQGRDLSPSVLCIDSQSVKLLPMSGEYRGMDAHKRVNGRKRTFVVDTQGRLWLADVDAANRADGSLAVPLVSSILWRCGERLEKRSAVAGLRRSVL